MKDKKVCFDQFKKKLKLLRFWLRFLKGSSEKMLWSYIFKGKEKSKNHMPTQFTIFFALT